MPTSTYDLIASNVLSSSATSVTFSSIPGTYKDLVLVITGTMATQNSAWIRFNGNSSNYRFLYMEGNGSSVSTGRSSTNQTLIYLSNTDGFSTSGNPTVVTIQINDYSASDKIKTTLCRLNRANGIVSMSAGRWENTSAITSILIDGEADYNSGSTFYLYGIVS